VHAKSGLKTQVQIEVEKAEQMKAMTRMEMQQYVINIDEILFKGKNTNQDRKKQKHRHKSRPIVHQKEDPYRPRPMELDRIKIRGNCYNYGKEGYRAKDYRSKGKEP